MRWDSNSDSRPHKWGEVKTARLVTQCGAGMALLGTIIELLDNFTRYEMSFSVSLPLMVGGLIVYFAAMHSIGALKNKSVRRHFFSFSAAKNPYMRKKMIFMICLLAGAMFTQGVYLLYTGITGKVFTNMLILSDALMVIMFAVIFLITLQPWWGNGGGGHDDDDEEPPGYGGGLKVYTPPPRVTI